MFLLNSRLSLFSAASRRRHSFSRSYGVILPSSLTTLLPLILGFSPRLPVSVCGTGAHILDRSFSRQREIADFITYFSFPVTPQPYEQGDLPPRSALTLGPVIHYLGSAILLCHSISQSNMSSTGISTCCPSPTLLSLGLGPD